MAERLNALADILRDDEVDHQVDLVGPDDVGSLRQAADLLEPLLARAEGASQEVEPSEPGSFVGDIFFGDTEYTTRGTHCWSGTAWEKLPSEEEVLTDLLAKARANTAKAEAGWDACKTVADELRDQVGYLCKQLGAAHRANDDARARAEAAEKRAEGAERERDRLSLVVSRLGSVEAFVVAGVIDPVKDAELLARIDFARLHLEPTK